MGHHEIRVALNGSVTLGLTCNGNRLLGVGRVDVGGVALRDPSRPIRPLITTPDVYTYDEFRVLADLGIRWHLTTLLRWLRRRAIPEAPRARIALLGRTDQENRSDR